MVILKGYERVKGEMDTGRQVINPETGEYFAEKMQYDNVILHYVSDDRKEVKGLFCENVKTKTETLRVVGAKTIDDCIGKEVAFGYDATAKVNGEGRVRPTITTLFCIGDVAAGGK